MIECVLNVSEGRDRSVVDEIAGAIGPSGATLLNQTSDWDHNRSVLTFAGSGEAVLEAAIGVVGAAAGRIDLTRHTGVHPRLGVADVIPFVPLEGARMEECAEVAREAGRRIWERFRIPVFLYEAAALRPECARLENVRRLAPKGLEPDIGVGRHPTAGVCVVGARPILVAWNINLKSTDLGAAKAIAREIRESSGGFPAVKSIGLPLASRGLVQVSINLVDYARTPLDVVFRAVEEHCARLGIEIAGSELIGAIPRAALDLSPGFDFRWENEGMLLPTALLSTALLAFQTGNAVSDRDFSGTWQLNPARSSLRSLPVAPAKFLRIEQSAAAMTLGTSSDPLDGFASATLTLGGVSTKSEAGPYQTDTRTKWEGAALLLTTIVSGPENYSVQERWSRTRDGAVLTITRTIVRQSGESESTLVYENESQPWRLPVRPMVVRPADTEPVTRAIPDPPAPAAEAAYVLAPGTRILLRLTNSVDTKRTLAGDHVYLQTAVPVFVNGKLVVPVGSYVNGTVIESERAGRVKGKSGLNIRFDSLTLPNGVTRDFRSRAGSVDTKGNLDRTEGRISGESGAGKDTKTVAGTTTAGAGIGTIAGAAAGHVGAGLGIGAAAGAIAGLAGVMSTRGPDVVLTAGTTMEMVLDREVRFLAGELR